MTKLLLYLLSCRKGDGAKAIFICCFCSCCRSYRSNSCCCVWKALSLKKTVGSIASCVERDVFVVRSVLCVAISAVIVGMVEYALMYPSMVSAETGLSD